MTPGSRVVNPKKHVCAGCFRDPAVFTVIEGSDSFQGTAKLYG